MSVIIPAYNAEQYIERSVSSVLNQTYINLEVIIIDDGSQDNTYEICQKIQDSRLKVYCQKNLGVSIARNNGIEVSKGEYIVFLDADDELVPDCLTKLLEKSEKNTIIICDYCIKDERGKKSASNESKELKNIDIKNLYNTVLKKMFITGEIKGYCWRLLIPRELAEDTYFYSCKIGEDALFFTDIMSKAKQCKYVDEALFIHYENPKSVTHQRYRKDYVSERVGFYEGLKEVLAHYLLSKEQERNLLYATILINRNALFRNAFKGGNLVENIKEIRNSIFSKPISKYADQLFGKKRGIKVKAIEFAETVIICKKE